MHDATYELLKRQVARFLDLDIGAYRQRQMRRRLDTWVAQRAGGDEQTFVMSLGTKSDALKDLRDALTINVTEFFRDQVQWTELEQHVLPQAPPNLKQSQLKKWLREKLKELFRCAQKPPRWIQGDCWAFRDNRPLVFLGQFNVSGYFHDEATVYVFHDPEAAPGPDECVTVIQTY